MVNPLKTITAKRDLLISALLIGNNAVNVLASALATSTAITLLGEGGVAFAATPRDYSNKIKH